jgi:S-adenosylmethionine:tRNA ribosyltransferase-isomerase
MMFSLSDYRYILPESLIAQEAIYPHHDARLMVVERSSGDIEAESTFWNLCDHISSDRVIFFNNSRVLPARIRLKENAVELPSGEKKVIQNGEILFCQKQADGTFEALVRP